MTEKPIMFGLIDEPTVTFDEATVTLPSGAVVVGSLLDAVEWLQSTGHTIAISDDGYVTVDPAINEDLLHCLDSNHIDIDAILRESKFL